MKKTIGIIGGMGPMATADLFKKIINMTDAACDNEHIRLCIDSNTAIPDRTKAILHSGPSPVREMVRSAIRLEGMGADVLLIPCNTAHYFYDQVSRMVNIPIINMIEETALEILARGWDCVGLLATDGTVQARVYDDALVAKGVRVLHPSVEGQQSVMDVIYKGIKAGRDIPLSGFLSTIRSLEQEGAQALILGCTELPIAFDRYGITNVHIDPTQVLAERAILFAGGRLLDGNP